MIKPFGVPKTGVSDKATCFISDALKSFIYKRGIEWKPVLAYAPMSDGRARRMVGNIKKSVGRLFDGSERSWEEQLNKAIYVYRGHPLEVGSKQN